MPCCGGFGGRYCTGCPYFDPAITGVCHLCGFKLPEHYPDCELASVICGGCGARAEAGEDLQGWRFTDAPWCPRCAWLA